MKNICNFLYNTLERIFLFVEAHGDVLGAIIASDMYAQLKALSVTSRGARALQSLGPGA